MSNIWYIKSAAESIVNSITLIRESHRRPSVDATFNHLSKKKQLGSDTWLEISDFQGCFELPGK